MRPRIPISAFVRRSVGPSVRPLVGRSVTRFLSAKNGWKRLKRRSEMTRRAEIKRVTTYFVYTNLFQCPWWCFKWEARQLVEKSFRGTIWEQILHFAAFSSFWNHIQIGLLTESLSLYSSNNGWKSMVVFPFTFKERRDGCLDQGWMKWKFVSAIINMTFSLSGRSPKWIWSKYWWDSKQSIGEKARGFFSGHFGSLHPFSEHPKCFKIPPMQ